MRDWIAVTITVLGVLLVLAGAVLTVLRALSTVPSSSPSVATSSAEDVTTEVPAAVPAPVSTRLFSAVKSQSPADRLIFWGIILLVLAAIAARAITFSLGADGGK